MNSKEAPPAVRFYRKNGKEEKNWSHLLSLSTFNIRLFSLHIPWHTSLLPQRHAIDLSMQPTKDDCTTSHQGSSTCKEHDSTGCI
jgi:hypothetical protein